MKILQQGSQEKETNFSQKRWESIQGILELSESPGSAFRKGAEEENLKRTTSMDAFRFQIPYTPYGPSRLQRQQEKHPNHIRKELPGPGGQAGPPCCLWPMPWQPWFCCPRAQPWTEALAWQKEWGERGTAKGNLNFCLCKSLLAPVTRPCAKRQPTVRLAICCDWRVKGFWK